MVPMLMMLDLFGLVLKWKTFDHAAHLGGAIFGVVYTIYGLPAWNDLQKYLYDKRYK